MAEAPTSTGPTLQPLITQTTAPLQFSLGKWSGMYNMLPPETIPYGGLINAVNCDIDDSGTIFRRPSFRNILAGNFHSLWANSNKTIILVRTGNQLLRLDYNKGTKTVSTSILRSDIIGTLPMSYTEAWNRVWYSDGINQGSIDNAGNLISWVIVPPIFIEPLSLIPGNLPVSTIWICATYLRSDGSESSTSRIQGIDLPKVSGVSIPLLASLDTTVTNIGIYASFPNGTEFYRLGTVDNVDQVFNFTDYPVNFSDFQAPTYHLLPMEAGHIVMYFHGRLYVARGDNVYYSLPQSPHLRETTGYFRFDGFITGLAHVEEESWHQHSGLVVGVEDKAVYWMRGSEAETDNNGKVEPGFTFIKKCEFGCVFGSMITYYKGTQNAQTEVHFINSHGKWVLSSGGEMKNVTDGRYCFPMGNTGWALYIHEQGYERYMVGINNPDKVPENIYQRPNYGIGMLPGLIDTKPDSGMGYFPALRGFGILING